MQIEENRPGRFVFGTFMAAAIVFVGIAALVVVLRTPTKPVPESQQVPLLDTEEHGPFDYGLLAQVLEEHVDELGMVDYAAIKAAPATLDAFLDQCAEYGPDKNAAMFTSEEEALAYWINAYNAYTLKAVADAYPVDSIMDIGEGDGAVFDEELCICGSEKLSLNEIESGIVRKRFNEPRIHFAFNCASLGCPPLPREPFLPETLDEQLEAATRGFLSRAWYCRVSEDGRTVRVSSILDWYGEDFLKWLKSEGRKEEIGEYLALYAPEQVGEALEGGAAIEYIEYDWRLTDQAADWSDSERG